MNWWDRVKNKPSFIRLFQWEYWPSISFYWPMFIYGPILALRSRHAAFFSAANPGIYISGFGHESKYETIQKVPEAHRPKSVLAKVGASFESLTIAIEQAGIEYPLIAKPDVGFRGLLVKKIDSPQVLKDYLAQYPFDFIVQEFLRMPEEIGVLYYRFPDQKKGKISSLTRKDFLHVVGDGQLTVEELVRKKPRALLQLDRLRELKGDLLPTIPNLGERVNLGVIGNHSKGTQFINANHLIDEALCNTFDRLNHQLDGIYYGRFDIKCESLDSLKTGGLFKIIEVNGICSEPTHIYDPTRHTYWKALKDIMHHWTIIQRLSWANYRRGVPFYKPMYVINAFRRLFAYQKEIKELGLK